MRYVEKSRGPKPQRSKPRVVVGRNRDSDSEPEPNSDPNSKPEPKPEPNSEPKPLTHEP